MGDFITTTCGHAAEQWLKSPIPADEIFWCRCRSCFERWPWMPGNRPKNPRALPNRCPVCVRWGQRRQEREALVHMR